MAARAPTSAVVAVLLVRLADESGGFLPSAAMESFRADLGLTYAQAGAVLALIAPGSLVGTLFTAGADRFSRRVIAAGGALGFAACLVAFALGASFAVLAGAAFGIGVATTAMVDAAEVALVDMAGDDLRPYLARGNLLAVLGDMAGPGLVAAVAVAGLSWRASFWVGAALLVVYALALAVSPLPPPPVGSDGGQRRQSAVATLVAVAGDGRVWLIGVMALLMAPFDEPLVGFTIALLEQERQASAAVATVVALVGVSGGLLTFTVLARRSAAIGDERLVVVAAMAMTVGATATAVIPVTALVAAAALVTSIGLNLGWLAVQHRTLTLRPGQVGTTKALVSAIELPGFAAPVVIGAVADASSLTAAVGLCGVLGAVLTALAVLARASADAHRERGHGPTRASRGWRRPSP